VFSAVEQAFVKFPLPAKVKIPLRDKSRDNHEIEPVNPELRRLPASVLKGSFLDAYHLLSRILKLLGWDALLLQRSDIFLMEEEYKSYKFKYPETPSEETSGDGEGVPVQNAANASSSGQSHSLEQTEPTKSAAGLKQKEDKLTRKSLCERWLDSLFMMLYEVDAFYTKDLKFYTIWRAQMAEFHSRNVEYCKSPAEWELLGDLAYRLLFVVLAFSSRMKPKKPIKNALNSDFPKSRGEC
jgi:hypothetical protein